MISKLLLLSLTSLLSQAQYPNVLPSIDIEGGETIKEDCTSDRLQLDIVFLLDSSSSIGQEEFSFGLNFLQLFVREFSSTELTGGSGTRFGMVQYNGVPYLEFHLDRHEDVEGLTADIADTEYIRGITLTGKAIQSVANAAFREYRGERRRAPNILVILTDGWSQGNIPPAVEDARGRGVDIFVVGIGGPRNYQELLLLADGRGEHIFELPTAANATEAADRLVQSTVNAMLRRLNEVYAWRVCGHSTTSRPDVLTASPPRFPVTSERLFQICPIVDCGQRFPIRADVVFLLDTTSSVTKRSFANALEFAVNVTAHFDRFGECDTRIGLVQYSTLKYLEIPFKRHAQIRTLLNEMRSVEFMQGLTSSQRAVPDPLGALLTEKRRAAPVLLIVFTDGWGHSEVETAVFEAARSGATVFVVGMEGPRELNGARVLRMALDRRENVFLLPDPNNETVSAHTDTINSMKNVVNRIHSETRLRYCETPEKVYTRFPLETPFPTTRSPGFRTTPTKATAEQLRDCSLLDAVFLVDSSSSINQQNHVHLLKFLSAVIGNFNSFGGKYGAQFGMVQYSSESKVEFYLNRHTNREELIADIENTTYLKGATWTGKAIDATVADVFQISKGDRPTAPNAIVIITDGWAQDDIETAAWRASRSGVQIFVVGVAPDFDLRHLEELALTRTERLVTLPAFDNLTLDAARETDRSIQKLVDGLKGLSNSACLRVAGEGAVTSQRLESTTVSTASRSTTQGSNIGNSVETTTSFKKTTRTSTPALSTDPEGVFPEENAVIECRSDGFSVHIASDQGIFTGWMYIKGRFDDAKCSNDHVSNRNASGFLSVQIGDCGIERRRMATGMEISGTVVMMHDRMFIRQGDRAFRVRCFYQAEMDKTVTNSIQIPGMIPTETIEVSAPMPSCQYTLRRDSMNGPTIRFAEVGTRIYHRWDCEEVNEGTYGVLVHSCTVSNPNGDKTVPIVDDTGCVSDSVLMDQLVYASGTLSVHTSTRAFGFADAEAMLFSCRIKFCLKLNGGCVGISPPQCQFRVGRRKKRTVQMEHPENVSSTLTVVEFFGAEKADKSQEGVRRSWDLFPERSKAAPVYCLSRIAVSTAIGAGIIASSLCIFSSAVLFRRYRVHRIY